jgi:hypothetical protein
MRERAVMFFCGEQRGMSERSRLSSQPLADFRKLITVAMIDIRLLEDNLYQGIYGAPFRVHIFAAQS